MGFILQLSILSLAVLVVCGTRVPPTMKCHWDEFRCPNQVCIPNSCLCDGNNDCGDNTDEQQDCPCLGDEFQCPGGACIAKLAVCDGVYDCGDGADEKQNCTDKCIDISSRCAHNAFQCNTSSYVQENCKKTCNPLCDIKPACDPLCPAIFDPVCGTDGVTYQNECSLGVAACQNPEADIRVQHKGECSACDPSCSEIFDPVCGTDGVTYENECSLGVVACQNPKADIRVQHKGECSDMCPRDPRPHGDCNQIVVGSYGHSAPQPVPITCYNDGDCADRFGAGSGHRCCRDACLGKTCKIAIPAIPKW